MRLPQVGVCWEKGKRHPRVYWPDKSSPNGQHREVLPTTDRELIKMYVEKKQKELILQALGITPVVEQEEPAPPLSELHRRYFKDEVYVPNVSASTLRDKLQRLKMALNHFGWDTPADKVDAQAMAEWKRELLEKTSETNAKNYLVNFMAMLEWARGAKLIQDYPRVSVPSGNTHRRQRISDDHATAIMKALDLSDSTERALFIALATGMRAGDIAGLTGDMFGDDGFIRKLTDKKEVELALPMPLPVMEALAPYAKGGLVCPEIRDIHAVQTITRHACGANYGLRVCRATWASGLANLGLEVLVVKALMAHTMDDVTVGYIMRDHERFRGVIGELPWLRWMGIAGG